MAVYQVVYWKEIPSQIEAREGATSHKEILSQRFQELIDIVAIKRTLTDADDYIAGWSKGAKIEQTGSARDVAKQVAADYESRYESIRAAALSGVAAESSS